MIRAVMFDLDGILHNREASILSFIENQRERLFPHLDKKVYAERFINLDQGGYVWKDKVYQQMVEEFSFVGKNYCRIIYLIFLYMPNFILRQSHCLIV